MFRYVDPFLGALSDGRILRLAAAWVVRVVGVLGALGGILWFLAFLDVGFKGWDASTGVRAAGLLAGCAIFALVGLTFGYLWLAACLFRARTILELGDSHFTVLSILSILFRLNGELSFVTYSLIGIGGCLFVWLADLNPFAEIGPFQEQVPFGLSSAGGFLGGIELGVVMLLIAFLGIVVSYALAELTIVLVEIALNTRGIRALAASVHANVEAAATHAALTMQPVCGECGKPLDPGAIFCGECGKAVATNGN